MSCALTPIFALAIAFSPHLALRADGTGCVSGKRTADGVACDYEQQMAPPLQLTQWMNTPDGKPLKLENLRGKVVVIDFWGTW